MTESHVLTPSEMRDLRALGNAIRKGLTCDLNGDGLPCATDRLSLLPMMARYLRIHGYTVREQAMRRADE